MPSKIYAAGISFMSSLLFVLAGTFPTVLESSMSLLKQPAGAVESPDKWRAKSAASWMGTRGRRTETQTQAESRTGESRRVKHDLDFL